jgi:hypothetical protein
MKAQEINVSAVDDDFTADVPLHCHTKTGPDHVRWMRVSSGANSLENPAGTTCELPPADAFLYIRPR